MSIDLHEVCGTGRVAILKGLIELTVLHDDVSDRSSALMEYAFFSIC